LLDTSVIVDGLLPSQPGHAACVAFLRDLAASETLVVFNRLLEVELYETLFNLALKERHGKRWASARYDGRVRRRAGRLLADGTRAWSELLDSWSWSVIELSEVSESVPELMRAYGFRSYDAVHAASLPASGLTHMATLDHGFAALPPSMVTVHTTAACAVTIRRRRAQLASRPRNR
jgi:predicted nucleic acid-binding protein